MAFISFLFIIISPLDFLKKRIVELNLQSKKLVNLIEFFITNTI
ncbi:protein of unknown function [Brochothrix thermosphacta]|nr:protein of unknown function [Brochothrix thermosphacta]